MIKKIEKVKDFSFIRKGPYYSDIFNKTQRYPAPSPLYKHARDARCLFIICVIVYNLYYCCYAKTISSAVQKRHSKVYGNRIAPSFYLILLDSMYLHCKHCLTRQEECTNDWNLEIRISVYQNQQESLLIIINNKNIVKVKFK